MVRLTVPAHVDALPRIREFVRQGGEATGLAPDEIDKLDLVMEELFMNIARHAYGPESGDVEVAYSVETHGRLLVEISDHGRAFDPLAGGPPDFSRGLAERPLGGMGIFLVKAMAESLRYERIKNHNSLTLVFSSTLKAE
jgi:anti-sigma regulatory factor (Ser/Thr protein kinase)